MADHSPLSVTDNYITLLETKLEGRLQDQARAFDPSTTAPTGIVIGTIRFTSVSGKWELWNGASWIDPVSIFSFPKVSTDEVIVTTGVRFNDNTLQTTAAPSLSGSGAVGTWNIDINGSAARTSYGNGGITSNIANGNYSLASNTTGYDNTAMGVYSLYNNTTGSGNTAIGGYCLASNVSGVNNMAIGSHSLELNTTGNSNVAYGSWTLRENTSGYDNTAIGSYSSVANLTGNSNIAIGTYSLYYNTTGNENTGIGTRSLFYNSGNVNTGIGFETLYNNTTGVGNTAVGANSLRSSTTGSSNTALGVYSLYGNITGQDNTAVGSHSLLNSVTFSNCVGLGNGAQVTGSDQVQLGNSSTTTYVYGTVQNRSDVRDKTDMRDTTLGLSFIQALRPVDYKWDMREDYCPKRPDDLPHGATDEQKKAHKIELAEWIESCKHGNIIRNGSKKRNRWHHGLLAQEVKGVMDAMGVDFGGYQDHKLSGGGDVLSLGYDEFIAPLIKSVQELSAQNTLLSARLRKLEEAINV